MSDNTDVFLNCPFDRAFQPLFNAAVFAVFDCGFRARCALEVVDGGEVRIEKLLRIVEQCRFGIHDVSRTSLDRVNRLPRFNMPFELGLFLGCKAFGGAAHAAKRCLILDRDRFRYQKFISDIAGQDIRAHANKPEEVIRHIRDWLQTASAGRPIPSGSHITERYARFRSDLPRLSRDANLDRRQLTFTDFHELATGWLRTYGS